MNRRGFLGSLIGAVAFAIAREIVPASLVAERNPFACVTTMNGAHGLVVGDVIHIPLPMLAGLLPGRRYCVTAAGTNTMVVGPFSAPSEKLRGLAGISRPASAPPTAPQG